MNKEDIVDSGQDEMDLVTRPRLPGSASSTLPALQGHVAGVSKPHVSEARRGTVQLKLPGYQGTTKRASISVRRREKMPNSQPDYLIEKDASAHDATMRFFRDAGIVKEALSVGSVVQGAKRVAAGAKRGFRAGAGTPVPPAAPSKTAVEKVVQVAERAGMKARHGTEWAKKNPGKAAIVAAGGAGTVGVVGGKVSGNTKEAGVKDLIKRLHNAAKTGVNAGKARFKADTVSAEVRGAVKKKVDSVKQSLNELKPLAKPLAAVAGGSALAGGGVGYAMGKKGKGSDKQASVGEDAVAHGRKLWERFKGKAAKEIARGKGAAKKHPGKAVAGAGAAGLAGGIAIGRMSKESSVDRAKKIRDMLRGTAAGQVFESNPVGLLGTRKEAAISGGARMALKGLGIGAIGAGAAAGGYKAGKERYEQQGLVVQHGPDGVPAAHSLSGPHVKKLRALLRSGKTNEAQEYAKRLGAEPGVVQRIA